MANNKPYAWFEIGGERWRNEQQSKNILVQSTTFDHDTAQWWVLAGLLFGLLIVLFLWCFVSLLRKFRAVVREQQNLHQAVVELRADRAVNTASV